MCDKLVSKVDNIDTSWLVLKTKYDIHKSDLQETISGVDKKVPNTSGLDWKKTKTDYNAKIGEIESKIPSVSGLVTISALTVVENKNLALVI